MAALKKNKKIKMPLSQRKLIAQSGACIDAVCILLFESMIKGKPADRSLANYLRQHRQYGSRDRRVISETVFAVFRWWGWLAPLMPRRLRECVQNAHIPDSSTVIASAASRLEWQRMLAFAHLMEGPPLAPVFQLWIQDLKLRVNRYALNSRNLENLVERAERAFALLAPEEKKPAFQLESLVPNWIWPELPKGIKRDALIEWLQRRPPVWLRCQRGAPAALIQELEQEGLRPQQHAAMKSALQIEPPRKNLRTLAAFQEGRLEVQDLASQAVAVIAAPKPAERWWDCCAGAGGKSLHLAQLMQNRGEVVASDIRAYKLDDLRKRAKRAGFFNIRCRKWSGEPVSAKRALFDGVLVDAPCSCSGTWRRNPDGRWTTTQEQLSELTELQLNLLCNAATGVKAGGRLVYATCSMFERENKGVVQEFLRKNRNFELLPLKHPFGRNTTVEVLQIWPWEGDNDAMFVALFQRRL